MTGLGISWVSAAKWRRVTGEVREVYQEYRSYCLRTGEYTRSTADFYNALESAVSKNRRKRTGHYLKCA